MWFRMHRRHVRSRVQRWPLRLPLPGKPRGESGRTSRVGQGWAVSGVKAVKHGGSYPQLISCNWFYICLNWFWMGVYRDFIGKSYGIAMDKTWHIISHYGGFDGTRMENVQWPWIQSETPAILKDGGPSSLIRKEDGVTKQLIQLAVTILYVCMYMYVYV